MSDLPQRVRLWRNDPYGELVVSAPGHPYPTGSAEYIRADLALPAVQPDPAAIREAALREAVDAAAAETERLRAIYRRTRDRSDFDVAEGAFLATVALSGLIAKEKAND